MVLGLFIFLILIIILYFIARSLIKNLHLFFYLITKNENTAIQIVTWILIIGTVLHEVSHMIVAELLGIRTFRFSFIPEVLEDNKIKAGSLEMIKPDPFRGTIIGLAPPLIGLTVISAIISFFLQPIIFELTINNKQLAIQQFFFLFTIFYLLFSISLTMFSSSKDLEPVFGPLLVLVIFLVLFSYAGVKISFSEKIINNLIIFFDKLNKSLSIALAINIILLLLMSALNKLLLRRQNNHHQITTNNYADTKVEHAR